MLPADAEAEADAEEGAALIVNLALYAGMDFPDDGRSKRTSALGNK